MNIRARWILISWHQTHSTSPFTTAVQSIHNFHKLRQMGFIFPSGLFRKRSVSFLSLSNELSLSLDETLRNSPVPHPPPSRPTDLTNFALTTLPIEYTDKASQPDQELVRCGHHWMSGLASKKLAVTCYTLPRQDVWKQAVYQRNMCAPTIFGKLLNNAAIQPDFYHCPHFEAVSLFHYFSEYLCSVSLSIYISCNDHWLH